MMLRKQKSAGYLANHMARLFANALIEQLRPLGLMPAQFAILLELWGKDGLTQKQLVDRLDIEQACIVNTLQRMERDELISRRPNPKDGRSQLVFITEKAHALEEDATRRAKALNARALSGLSEVEREAFLDMMRRVIESLQEERDSSS
jgi:DNA-binding MarR family transcriptional regulator